MHVPSADELAAIAVAYLAVTDRAEERTVAGEAPRWRLAGRVENLDPQLARVASRSGSRWKIAGRLDG
jgi:hypothetical protein